MDVLLNFTSVLRYNVARF